MGNLYARLQEFIGEKIFRDKASFDGDVVFKRHVTGYTPVSSEANCGSYHPKNVTLVDAVNPAATADVTVTAEGPTGIKAICGRMSVASTNTANRTFSIVDMHGNVHSACSNVSTSIGGRGFFIVPVDGNKHFAYHVDDADVTSVSIFQTGYFI